MPTLTIALDGRELQRLPLTRARTTVGRRPYNDIVMEHLAVSGEHAVFVLEPDGQVQVLDLNSTNGTYVNGRAVVSAPVGPDDLIEIARYQLRVVKDGAASGPARILIEGGSAAGKTMPLVKAATRLGKPGVAVVVIAEQAGGHTITWAEGDAAPTVNGQPLGHAPVALSPGDRIEIAGTAMRYLCD